LTSLPTYNSLLIGGFSFQDGFSEVKGESRLLRIEVAKMEEKLRDTKQMLENIAHGITGGS